MDLLRLVQEQKIAHIKLLLFLGKCLSQVLLRCANHAHASNALFARAFFGKSRSWCIDRACLPAGKWREQLNSVRQFYDTMERLAGVVIL